MNDAHQQLFDALLAEHPRKPAVGTTTFVAWAEREHVQVPGAVLAFIERLGVENWTLNGLTRFAFDQPELRDVQGRRALRIQTGLWRHFEHAVPLDAGDDPPVFYKDERRGWRQIAASFSDHVLGELFDQSGRASRRLVAHGDDIEARLRQRFAEMPSTMNLTLGDERTVTRFMRSARERITIARKPEAVFIDIHGDAAAVATLEAEVRTLVRDRLVHVDLSESLRRLGYHERWLTSGLLPERTLLMHDDIFCTAAQDEGVDAWERARSINPLSGTEHYRYGAVTQALDDPGVASGDKLDDLLFLAEIDPECAMSSLVARHLLSDDSPLSMTNKLKVAKHPASARAEDTLLAAIALLRKSATPLPQIRATIGGLLMGTETKTQLGVLRHAFDPDVFSWCAEHGANRRVRAYARHGLHRHRMTHVGGTPQP